MGVRGSSRRILSGRVAARDPCAGQDDDAAGQAALLRADRSVRSLSGEFETLRESEPTCRSCACGRRLKADSARAPRRIAPGSRSFSVGDPIPRFEVVMADDINAFVPGPRVHIEGRPGGPLSGLTFAAKDLFDVAGHPTGGGNPDWAQYNPVPTRHAWAVQRLLDAGASADRQDHHRRGLARHRRRERVLRHAGQCPRPGPGAGRLVLGLGRGGRGGALRHRDRHRHRRFGAGAGKLLRALRHPPDAWPDRRHGHVAAGAEFGHDRLVRPRRRDLCPRVERHARRGDPGGAADPADRRGRRLCFCRS